ncbi:MAG: hypothetical protein K9W46_09550 [Candidatus Heimdallarchaeum endolithica]|uniref:Uncharacterized protein n=1 Tax=Candidatus Heimdallarchaeum endolithica TaxID=2876572 RepID=A0A9Y1FMP5_9ARCH|nr:MAG: hypothetical protein K9W46_09550 [Candidatus Heimdallarchaeum endolithica]
MTVIIHDEKKNNSTEQISFTGNWYIDAGILGYIFLIEDVYGESFDKIISQPLYKEKFYYAYFLYYIKETAIKWINKQDLASKSKTKKKHFEEMKRNLQKELLSYKNVPSSFQSPNEVRQAIIDINNHFKDEIKESFSEFECDLKNSFGSKTSPNVLKKIENVGIIFTEPFFLNLPFCNPSKNKKGKESDVFLAFEDMLYRTKIKGSDTPNALDKTISKFMFAESEALNILYCKIQTLDDFNELFEQSVIIYLLCFPIAFTSFFEPKFILFYTNNLHSSYHINKSIRLSLNRLEKKDRNKDVLKVTWNSILDYMFEQKSIFSLENMYVIEHDGVDNQQNIQSVNYIGISKLHASILLDNKIRSNINIYLKYQKIKKKYKQKWLLREFISGRPLYPLILQHCLLCITDSSNKIFRFSSSLYSLIIEAIIRELKNEKRLFSKDFFSDYNFLVRDINEEIRNSSYYSSLILSLIPKDEKLKLSTDLIHILLKKQKIYFLNYLLKKLNECNKKDSKKLLKKINKWLFDKVVLNEHSWQEYALIIILQLIK